MQTVEFPQIVSVPSFIHISPSFVNHLFFPALVGILILFFILYSIVSGVLVYHWNSYGMGNRKILIAEVLFLGVSTFLLFVAASSLYYY